MRWREKKAGEEFRELKLLLDRESQERLSRIRSRLSGMDNNELISLSLKCLEQRVESIIRRRRGKRLREGTDDGRSHNTCH
jgi:hypothetical protein